MHQVVLGTALAAGVFTLLVCLLLIVVFAQRAAENPMDDPRFTELKARLAENPGDEELKGQIRELDLRLREEYFQDRRFAAFGAYLLLGGVVVTVASSIWAAALSWKAPRPEPLDATHDRDARVGECGRSAVAALAGALVGGALVAALAFPTMLPEDPEELAVRAEDGLAQGKIPSPPTPLPGSGARGAGSGIPSKPGTGAKPQPSPGAKPTEKPSGPDTRPGFASDEEKAKYWPRFRGPFGSGVSAYDNVPTAWDDKSGKGIAWKTAVPLPGNSSPIVWKDRVLLTGADQQHREVYCFDAAGGKLLWRKEAPSTPASTAKIEGMSKDTGYAAPTMTTDGRRVFAIFANGDVAALDLAGNVVWARSLGIPKANHYGHASSLEMYEDLLLVLIDQGTAKDDKSKLLALNNVTGKTVWEQGRPVAASWATPAVVYHQGKPQLLTAADPWLTAYRPRDGSEIWRAGCIEGENGVCPVYWGGFVYAGNEYCRWSAVRADGQGDVTETKVAWTAEDNLPDQCSPLATDKYVCILQSYGMLTCYEAASGQMLWEKEFEGAAFTSSPGLAAGRIYVFGELDTDQQDAEGMYIRHCKAWILEPGAKDAKIVGEGNLEEGCVTSPAFQDGRIYIRGKKHLFCLGEKTAN